MPVLNESQLSIAKRIYNAALSAGVPKDKAIWIVAQSGHETAYWTSNVFKQNNNGFGMKMPSQRNSPYILGPGTQPPAGEGPTPYAKFASIENSTRDLVHWLNYHHINWNAIHTPGEYVSFLRSKNFFYGNEGAYINNVTSFTQQLKEFMGNSGNLLNLAIVAFLIYAAIR